MDVHRYLRYSLSKVSCEDKKTAYYLTKQKAAAYVARVRKAAFKKRSTNQKITDENDRKMSPQLQEK